MQTLGRRLASARHETGLSLAGLGKLVGLSEGTIRGYEADRVVPPLPNLQRLADALGHPVGYFLEPDEDGASEQVAGVTISGPAEVVERLMQAVRNGASPEAVLQPYAGRNYPGIRELLADAALCAGLEITDEERHLLLDGYSMPVGPQTKAEAITLLTAIRSMSARRTTPDQG